MMIRRSATAIFHGSQKTAGQMRRCSKTGQYLSPSAWALEIVQPVDFMRYLSGKCRLSAQSGVEVHRLRSFLFGQGTRPIRQVPWRPTKKGRSEDRPFIIPVTGLIRSPCRPVWRAGDAGPLKRHWRPTKKGRSEDRPFIIPVTGLIRSPCRPVRRAGDAGPLKGHGRPMKKGRPEDRPFIIPVTGLIRSPCRPCRRPALPASERPSSEARRSWLRW